MTDQSHRLLSEDPNAGHASPVMDLAAAAMIAAISIWIAIESLLLPIPGGIMTAPALLPFLTAGSLLAMAGLLAAAALRRRRTAPPGSDRFEWPVELPQSMLLGAIFVVYVAGLQFLPIELVVPLGKVRLVIGNFEVVSVVVLTAILRIFWPQPLWMGLAVSAGWIAFLSLMFRLVFEIRLP